MSFKMRLLALIIMGTGLTACGGGGGSNDNLFNPAEDTTDATTEDGDSTTDSGDSTDDTSDNSGLVLFGTEYAGFFLEDPYYNPEDPLAGGIYFKSSTRPDKWEDGDSFNGIMSFKSQACQKDNIVQIYGSQQNSDMYGAWQGDVDGTLRSGTISPLTFEQPIIKGSYTVTGGRIRSTDNSIADCTVDHYLSPQGKIELFPLNSTHYGSNLTYTSVISIEGNKIDWNYDGNSDSTSLAENMTISLIDKSAADQGITVNSFLWQEVIAGNSTTFTFPSSVKLVANNVYVVAVTGWTPGTNTYSISFHSNLEFTAQ